MEGMGMIGLFGGAYKGKTVLVTGHTGFKGSWLALWLSQLGAKVIGYSLEPPSRPNHIELLRFNIVSITGDIRDREKLEAAISTYRPDIVFHLAAQSLVRLSYREPVTTFETNVIGTINVFEACRKTDNVKAIVNVTSDKCYENKEWDWGYRENDPMGGYDPYSASKGCAELLTSAYRKSFFDVNGYDTSHHVLLASTRAGNVVGGGDWAEDRLIPDIMRAVSKDKKVKIRNPRAIRPWQHVLEPLSGYLCLGQKLLEGRTEFADGWNFGPGDALSLTVGDVVEKIKGIWKKIEYVFDEDPRAPHEAYMLKLDCSKANNRLRWRSVWDAATTFEKTVNWYQEYYEKGGVNSLEDVEHYIHDAGELQMEWALT